MSSLDTLSQWKSASSSSAVFGTAEGLKPARYASFPRISAAYTTEVVARANQRFSPEDCAKLEEMLTIVSRELMPEVNLPERRTAEP